MANDISQDPLKIDTTDATGAIRCRRIRAVKFDGTAAQTCSIVDHATSHVIWSSTGGTPGPFDDINVTIPGASIDVTISGGTLYIYEGSGPR